MRRRRINPALVISIFALIGAWGGPAIAQSLVGSKQIKNRSIKGRDVASRVLSGRQVTALTGRDILPDSLNGSDIREETLRKVAQAESADTVAGVTFTRFAYQDPRGERATFYEAGGLRVDGFCNNGVLEARAFPTVGGGLVRRSLDTPTTGAEVVADNDFVAGERIDLLPPGRNDGSGTLTFYEPGGATVTIQYLAASGLPPESGQQCIVAGVAVRAER